MHTATAQPIYKFTFTDEPVGHHMRGAAYGENMKGGGLSAVMGVVTAVAAVYTGGLALGAYAAGETTIAQALAGGAMFAGGVMSGVGAVTGNKKLSQIGGVLTLAGGIGTWATGAAAGSVVEGGVMTGPNNLESAWGNLTSNFSESAARVTGSTAAEMGGANAASVMAPKTGADMLTNQISGGVGATTGNVAAGGSAYAPTIDVNAAAPSLGDTVAASTGAAQTASSAVGTSGSVTPILDNGPNPTAATGGGNGLGSPTEVVKKPTEVVNKPGILGQALEGIQKNKEAVKIGADFVTGIAASANTPDQQALVDAQTAMINANMDTAQFNLELAKQKNANRNTIPVALSQNDPLYAQKAAAAQAQGFKVVTVANVGTPTRQGMNVPTSNYAGMPATTG